MRTHLLVVGLASLSLIAAVSPENIRPQAPQIIPVLNVTKQEGLKLHAEQRARARQTSATSVKSSSSSSSATVIVPSGTCSPAGYKSVKFALTADIPSTWSYFMDGTVRRATDADYLQHPFFSIAEDGVTYSNTNGNQLDAIKVSGADIDTRIQSLKTNNPNGTWSQEIIDGRTADVFTFAPNDNGQPGNTLYFLSWNVSTSAFNQSHPYDLGLVFQKQPGNASFNCGVQHFLTTIDLDAFAQKFLSDYPRVQ